METQSYFIEIVIAGIGGLVVVAGLLMEHFGDRDWYEYKLLPKGRSKSVKYIGEWLVIIGVAIEVFVACITANNEWQNNPANRPITSLRATVNLIVDGTNGLAFSPQDNITDGVFTRLRFRNSENLKESLPESGGWEWGISCRSARSELYFGRSAETEWILEFDGNAGKPIGDISSPLGKDAATWDTVEIEEYFIPANTKIVFCEITLTAEPLFTKHFRISSSKIKSLEGKHSIDLKSITVVGSEGNWMPPAGHK